MKHAIIIILLLINSPIHAEKNASLTAGEILQRSIDISTPETMISTTEQIAHFYTGKKQKFIIKHYTKNRNDKILFIYDYPKRLKGNKFLFLKGGDIWAYFSKTGRKRRIGSSARKSKMQGSDFSYEDISMMSTLVEDFHSKIIKEEKADGENCYVMQLKPKDKDKISYNKLLCWIDKKNLVLRKIEFYDNKLIKYMVQKDYKKIKKYFIPYTTIMKSMKDDTKTESFMKKVEVNKEIDDRKFNKNAL